MKLNTHILGFPRIGKNRELKKALESYWKNKSTHEDLFIVSNDIKKKNWALQKNLDLLTLGDYALYDHILDASLLLGNIPQRFNVTKLSMVRTNIRV